MFEANFQNGTSSITSQNRPTSRSTPRPLVSFQSLTDRKSNLAPPFTRSDSSSSRATPSRDRKDPLSNFRADAPRPPKPAVSPVNLTTAEDDMQGIEDITASQWEACPPGRSRNGGSSSNMGDVRESDDDATRWDGEGSTRKRKGLHEREGTSIMSKPHRSNRYLLSPSSSPAKSKNLKNSSPVSRSGPDENLDMYAMSLVDDETPESAKLSRKQRKRVGSGEISEGEAEHSTKDESEDEGGSRAEDEEEEAASSERSSSPFPDSLITPHVEKADDDAVQWSPSPLSPRSMARRNRSSSTTNPSKRTRVSETPPFINDSQVEDGEAGPSSPPSARSRSTSRRAAVEARARSRRYIVLSDDEDDDYDPFVQGDKDAFTNEYKRQVEQEAQEPEETDGSDGDDDMGEEKSEANGTEDLGGEEEEDDFYVLASQQPPPKSKSSTSTTKKTVKTTITFNNQAQAGPSRIPWQPPQAMASVKPSAPVNDQADEYDDLPTNFFDDVDLDEISHSNPSNNSQSGPAPQLNNLFSSTSPKGSRATFNSTSTSRPTTSHSNTVATSRVPLSDLPSSNIRPSASRPQARKSVLQLIEDDDLPIGNAQVNAQEEEMGYVPVSQMPARWRDFFLNHWRRGADKSKITNAPRDEAEEEDDEPVPAASKSRGGKTTKSTRGAAVGSRGRGASKGGARAVVRRNEDEGEEDDYEGDLGGPGAPAKSSGRGWSGRGRGRGGARRGGYGRKKAVARKR